MLLAVGLAGSCLGVTGLWELGREPAQIFLPRRRNGAAGRADANGDGRNEPRTLEAADWEAAGDRGQGGDDGGVELALHLGADGGDRRRDPVPVG